MAPRIARNRMADAMRHPILAALALSTLLAAGAEAQLGPSGGGLGTTPRSPGAGMARESHIQREVRSIEGRAVTQPGLAATQAENARRALLRSGQGADLSPEAQRANRQLEGVIQDEQARRAMAMPGPVDRPTPELPSSYDERNLLPGMAPTDLAENLLDRAADGLTAGRTDQARSDLALAEREIDGLSRRLGAEDPELALLRARAKDLRQRMR